MNNKFHELKQFILSNSVAYENEIIRTARIEEDLNITGDDAVDFIIKYGKHFGVDVSNFMAAKYFDPEGDKFILTIIRFFQKNKKRERSLTVQDLERGILYKKLDEEVINHEL